MLLNKVFTWQPYSAPAAHCSVMSSSRGAQTGDRHPETETGCSPLLLLGMQFHIITEWIIPRREDRLINLVATGLFSYRLPVKHVSVRWRWKHCWNPFFYFFITIVSVEMVSVQDEIALFDLKHLIVCPLLRTLPWVFINTTLLSTHRRNHREQASLPTLDTTGQSSSLQELGRRLWFQLAKVYHYIVLCTEAA